MTARTNAHDLHQGLLAVIHFVIEDPDAVTRLDLVRTYSGAAVDRLIDGGHLNDISVNLDCAKFIHNPASHLHVA